MIDVDESMDDPEEVDIEQTSPRFELGKIAIYGSVLGLLGILGWGLIRVQAGPRSSGVAPDFTLYTFGGDEITLSELRGQVVVINFWASWCPPCKEEAPYLEQMWRKYKDQGVVFLGVDYVDTEPEALAYIAEFDITYPNGPDLRTDISQAYRIQGVPETFFVAKDGTLKGVKVGPLFPPELEDRIEELIADPYE
jgi:cytochrome c biogenesis protein CcmG/thiol:disulfide interchange protein DsbE